MTSRGSASPTWRGPSRRQRSSWMHRYLTHWHEWHGSAAATSRHRTLPTWHGHLRRWLVQMSRFSSLWRRRQSGAWVTSSHRASPTWYGRSLQLSTVSTAGGMRSCLQRWRGRRSDTWRSSRRRNSSTQHGRLPRQLIFASRSMHHCVGRWRG